MSLFASSASRNLSRRSRRVAIRGHSHLRSCHYDNELASSFFCRATQAERASVRETQLFGNTGSMDCLFAQRYGKPYARLARDRRAPRHEASEVVAGLAFRRARCAEARTRLRATELIIAAPIDAAVVHVADAKALRVFACCSAVERRAVATRKDRRAIRRRRRRRRTDSRGRRHVHHPLRLAAVRLAELGVKSCAGEGTTFRVTLPRGQHSWLQ